MQTFDKVRLLYILFEHAFTECDTTSSIFNFGKTSTLSKIQQNTKRRELADNFYIHDIDPLEIWRATVKFFELLHSSTLNLSQVCEQKYQNLLVSNQSNIQPAMLPPSPRAIFHHVSTL